MPPKDPSLALPEGLPVPVDDGAARHLAGASLPRLTLPSTANRNVSLRDASILQPVVVFAYPKTGAPGQAPKPEWDAIPGARGCTPQARAYRDLAKEFEAVGVRIFGLSTQTTDYQKEMAQRLQLPFEVLSDHEYRLQQPLRLPTFSFQGEELLRRLTLFLRNGRIVKAFYPVFPPDENAAQVLAWVQGHLGRK